MTNSNKTPDMEAEAVAWQYELANYINPDGSYTGWDRQPRLSFDKPEVPEGSIRNLTPLFATPPKAPIDVGAVEALRDLVNDLDLGRPIYDNADNDRSTMTAARAALRKALAGASQSEEDGK